MCGDASSVHGTTPAGSIQVEIDDSSRRGQSKSEIPQHQLGDSLGSTRYRCRTAGQYPPNRTGGIQMFPTSQRSFRSLSVASLAALGLSLPAFANLGSFAPADGYNIS